MARRSSTTEEIKSLAAELRAPRRKNPAPDDGAGTAEAETVAASPSSDALDSLVDQLREALDDGLEDTRAFAGKHPVAAVSAAFLLGLVVGRLWRAA